MNQPFFDKDEPLSAGQCPYSRIEDHELHGTPLPPYEPVDDPYAGSQTLVEKLRADIECFDQIGGYEPDRWGVVISNLFTLADLANAAAIHIRRQLDTWEAEEAA